MERSEVLQVMREKAEQLLEVAPEDLQESTSFADDLHVESLTLVEYAMDLEDALGIELDEQDVSGLGTIGQYLDVIMKTLDTALNRDG